MSGTTLLHFLTSNRRLPGRTHKTSELRRRGDTPISIILLWKFISILQESCECFPFFDSHRFHMCVSDSVLYIVLSLHAFNNHMCYIKTQQQHKNSTRLQSVSLRCVWDFLRSLTHPPPSSASTRCPLPLCCVVFHML